MIIVNAYFEKDYNPRTDGYTLLLAGVINDDLDLNHDPQIIQEAIDNSDEFQPEAGSFYEIQLIRATIDADPIPERAFSIDRVIKKKWNEDFGWITPTVRM